MSFGNKKLAVDEMIATLQQHSAVVNEYDTGLNTTPDMWKMVSGLLDGEKLPESISEAIYRLCRGEANVVMKHGSMSEKHMKDLTSEQMANLKASLEDREKA